MDQWIAPEVLGDLGTAAVGDLGIGPRVSQEANAPQMQERGAAGDTHVFGGCQSRVVHTRDVGPLGAEIAQMRAIRPTGAHPVAGRPYADAKAVVLAAEQDRDR